MLYNEKRVDFEINGHKGFFSTGKIARKAQSAVLAGLGDTVILATIGVGEAMPESDYFPMSVEYIEKMAAAGMVSSSRFVKRERFPSDDAILRARIIDRSMRPMFAEDYRNEVQILVEVLSFDPEHDPNILAINAVSAALLISKAAFLTPVAGVRVGFENSESGELKQLFNHMNRADRDGEKELVKLNIVLAGDGEKFTNIDADAYEVEESVIIDAMKYGLDQMAPWIEAQKKFVELMKPEKAEYLSFALPEVLVSTIKSEYSTRILEILDISACEDPQFHKTLIRSASVGKVLLEEINKRFDGQYSKTQVKEAYEKVAKYLMRKLIKDEKRRLDGRLLNQIREFDTEVSVLPRVHGSSLFTRGLTQVLSTVTLGTIRSQQMLENMTGEDNRSYMHFYTQYPFTMGSPERYKYQPGRREIGHGAVAEKALIPVLPSIEQFPYTIIVNSDIMSENGSSSMGSACASSLALMEAGVPIRKHVAGIALGLIWDEENPDDFLLLTDMRDLEDFYGLMDFKVTGTRDGVTAIQFDTKSKGLPLAVFEKAIMQSKEARMVILDNMYNTISEPRKVVSAYAPKVNVVKIPVSKIGELIGPGGKNIKAINEKAGTEIEIKDDGTVYIFSDDQAKIDMATKIVSGYAFEPKVGEIYEGIVDGVVDFGAFVELAPGVSGLVHVSELSDEYVKDVRSVVKEGETMRVKLISIDDNGKLKLSKKKAK